MTKTVYCSFCGRGSDEAGKMMESSDRLDKRNLIWICLECARLAVETLERFEAEPKSE